MAQVMAACERCGSNLEPDASYCERCGTRTRRARRLVGIAIRVELLVFALVAIIVIGFAWIYSSQS
ncbi:MAG TPA: hypothetical protein VLU92_02045 [Candidatus Dormibacteraeota bacterium]|nr:hypothetical protein [Candidatus Dormibacteraeota bacterium]